MKKKIIIISFITIVIITGIVLACLNINTSKDKKEDKKTTQETKKEKKKDKEIDEDKDDTVVEDINNDDETINDNNPAEETQVNNDNTNIVPINNNNNTNNTQTNNNTNNDQTNNNTQTTDVVNEEPEQVILTCRSNDNPDYISIISLAWTHGLTTYMRISTFVNLDKYSLEDNSFYEAANSIGKEYVKNQMKDLLISENTLGINVNYSVIDLAKDVELYYEIDYTKVTNEELTKLIMLGITSIEELRTNYQYFYNYFTANGDTCMVEIN